MRRDEFERQLDEMQNTSPFRYKLCTQADKCPFANQCLRALAFANHRDDEFQEVVNPARQHITENGCEYFRPDKTCTYGYGFRQFYSTLDREQRYQFREAFSSATSRTQFYEMRAGNRLITPGHIEKITKAAQAVGITLPDDWLDISYQVRDW